MKPCEDHEIALERRAAGELAEDEALELERHLRGCASCTRYTQQMAEIQAMVQSANASAAITPPRFNRAIAYRIRREQKLDQRLRRAAVVALAAYPLILLTSFLEDGRGPRWIVIFAGGALASALVNVWLRLRAQRELREVAESADDIMAVELAAVRHRQLLTQALAVVLTTLGALGLLTGLGFAPVWIGWLGSGEGAGVALAAGAVCLALALFVVFVKLPRQRRDRREYE